MSDTISTYDNAEHCMFCGAQIPEGWQVCPICNYKLSRPNQKTVLEEVRIIVEESRKEN